MFFRMVKGALFRQRGKMLMIAFTIALGASLATAMLNVMLDVGDKVNQELKAYGANIRVVPQGRAVISQMYDVEGEENAQSQYLAENELGNIKTIFWAFNIVDFAPFLDTQCNLNSEKENIKVTGTWFTHHLSLPTGEELDAGMVSLRSWWEIDGTWIDDNKDPNVKEAMVGADIARKYGLKPGDTLKLSCGKNSENVNIKAVFSSDGEEDSVIYVPLALAQKLSDKKGLVSSIDVSALTTPDNELAKKAAQKGPSSLSKSDYETWYCTAYSSSICYQIQEVITNSVASQVRQVTESEGSILEKTQLLMLLITILSLIGSALGISNLVTASVMERSKEIGLLKAIGANDGPISGLILTEIIITSIFGGIIGYFVGLGFAQIIGHTVFNSAIDIKPMVIPIVAVLVVTVTLVGSLPAVKMLLGLRPTEVLHGR